MRGRASAFVGSVGTAALVCVALLALVGCGEDDEGAPVDGDGGSPPGDAARDDGAPAGDAGGPADAGALDASGPDAGMAGDAGALDGGREDGAAPLDAGGGDAAEQPLDPRSGLPGVWEVTGFMDSGGPFMAAPPGRFLVFDESTVRLGCDDPTGLAYSLVAGPGGMTAVHVDLGGSAVDWVIVELTPTRFVFVEGGDFFFHERRDACP